MLGNNKQLLFLLIFLFATNIYSQNKKLLQEKKEQIERDIKYTNKLLEKTKNNKEKSLNYLRVLNNQVTSREQLIQMLNEEIDIIEKQINKNKLQIIENQNNIKEQEGNLKKLEDEYAKMLYYTYRSMYSYDIWSFVFSSSSFNQAYKRIKYLKQYSDNRKNQAQIILDTKNEYSISISKLEKQKIKLKKVKENKHLLIESKKVEVSDLEDKQRDKKVLIKKLKKSENHFKKELQKQQYIAKELDTQIRRIIEEEIKKEREKKKIKGYALTPETKKLSDNFLENKGLLPWPLDKGVIIKRFGKQKHEIFKDVETQNNGIDIATDPGEKVRSIFDGKVARIFLIKGQGKVVLINHGEYFSVYSGLSELNVEMGEKVYSKQQIGIIRTNQDQQKTHLHFEIWKNYEKQNPAHWLYSAD